MTRWPWRISDTTVFSESSGFRLFLGQPWEFPLLNRKHLLLHPGLKHSVEISASHISTDMSSDPPGLRFINEKAKSEFLYHSRLWKVASIQIWNAASPWALSILSRLWAGCLAFSLGLASSLSARFCTTVQEHSSIRQETLQEINKNSWVLGDSHLVVEF